jgi:hypothetical protein
VQNDAVLGDDMLNRIPLLDGVDVVYHGSFPNRVRAVRDGLWQRVVQ